MTQKVIDWIRLSRTENIGPITFYKLLNRFGSAKAALEQLPEMARNGGKSHFNLYPVDAAERELSAIEKLGGFLLLKDDLAYPNLLKQTRDAPPILSGLGDKTLLESEKSIAIVGSRNASLNGLHIAKGLAQNLGTNGYTIVSGLAKGIDAAAHVGSIDTGTIAVLGGGIDVVYPKENATLYKKIKEKGLILSEFFMGEQPQAHHFPRRNRIIAGLCSGVVIVEATSKSGSMSTASHAADYGRDVFAVPGSPLDPRSQGPNLLIKNGAVLVESSLDITNNQPFTFEAWEEDPEQYFPHSGPISKNLKEIREKVLGLLSTSPCHIEDLIIQLGVSPSIISDVLLELELAGGLQRLRENKVSLKPYHKTPF